MIKILDEAAYGAWHLSEMGRAENRRIVSFLSGEKIMKYDFDQIVERKGTDSIKWQRYGNDVVPLWVADMDFVSPEPVVRALHERVDHRVFGYGGPSEELISAIQERLKGSIGGMSLRNTSFSCLVW